MSGTTVSPFLLWAWLWLSVVMCLSPLVQSPFEQVNSACGPIRPKIPRCLFGLEQGLCGLCHHNHGTTDPSRGDHQCHCPHLPAEIESHPSPTRLHRSPTRPQQSRLRSRRLRSPAHFLVSFPWLSRSIQPDFRHRSQLPHRQRFYDD